MNHNCDLFKFGCTEDFDCEDCDQYINFDIDTKNAKRLLIWCHEKGYVQEFINEQEQKNVETAKNS